MARPKNLWKHKESHGRGTTVWVEERTPGGSLYLRYRDPAIKQWRWECLQHTDRELAIERAADLSVSLRTGRDLAARGGVGLAWLFDQYEQEESVDKKGRGLQEDRRRMDIWQAYLGDHFDVHELTARRIKAFRRDRAAGRIRVADRKLEAKVSDTTIGNDVRFLVTVLNWAAREGIIERNPIRDVEVPRNVNVRRPVASYDRFLALRPHCDGLFGCFMDLVESLGWRVSALRMLKASDLDLQRRPGAPHGRILKRGETDKRGVEMWVPLPQSARVAIDELLKLNPVVGDAYLFPSPKAKGKPWGQRYTWGLLRKAERAAGLEHLERGAFHPYRRKWVRERKHLPRADVAAAGGWLSLQTLDLYDGADDETLFTVVSEPRKLREAQ